MESSLQPTLVQIRIGAVKPLGPRGVLSGFVGGVIPGRVHRLGLNCDAQADLVNHGGVDKPVYSYALRYHAARRNDYPHIAQIGELSAMGENLSIAGQTEGTVYVGNIYRVGTCVPQVTQPRKPCITFAIRFNEDSLLSRLVRTGRSGWHFRVLIEGTIAAGKPVQLMQRLHPDWSIARVAWVIYEPQSTEEELSELRATKAAAPAWRLHLEAARSARIARRFRNLYWHIRENEIVQQSNTIKSFVFEPTDGNRVLPHRPDQYLTLRFTPGGRTSLLIWTYSFAATSNGRNYAISVKREGEGSAGCTTMSALAPKSRSASPEASSFSINKPVSAPDHLGRRRHRAAPCRPTSRWKSVTPSDERPASPQ